MRMSCAKKTNAKGEKNATRNFITFYRRFFTFYRHFAFRLFGLFATFALFSRDFRARVHCNFQSRTRA